MSKRLIPLDPCKVNFTKLKRLPVEGLFKVHHRVTPRGSRHMTKDALHRALGRWASNYGAAKMSMRAHKNDPAMARMSARMYLKIAKAAKREFDELRARSCPR